MKRIIEILGFAILLLCLISGCRTNKVLESPSMTKRLRMACPPQAYIPIYLVLINEKQIQIDPQTIDSVLLNQINANWISEITVDKSTETIKKYEKLTSDGLLVMRLKNKSERKLTKELKNAFKNDNQIN